MAHLVVYVQRTPQGIHPGSAIALSLARDIASSRGATVTALCTGDAGSFDDHVAARCAALGADQLYFVGPKGIAGVTQRLLPRHIITAWTQEATQALDSAGIRPLVPRWISDPDVDLDRLEPVLGIVAGSLPWYALSTRIDAEYEGDVAEATVPDWIASMSGPERDDQLVYVAPADLDGQTRGELGSLGAKPVAPDYALNHDRGTLLWLDAGPNGLPVQLASRAARARVILFPGPTAQIHDSWNYADWVLAGDWPQAVRQLHSAPWKEALT